MIRHTNAINFFSLSCFHLSQQPAELFKNRWEQNKKNQLNFSHWEKIIIFVVFPWVSTHMRWETTASNYYLERYYLSQFHFTMSLMKVFGFAVATEEFKKWQACHECVSWLNMWSHIMSSLSPYHSISESAFIARKKSQFLWCLIPLWLIHKKSLFYYHDACVCECIKGTITSDRFLSFSNKIYESCACGTMKINLIIRRLFGCNPFFLSFFFFFILFFKVTS